ncbi:hypothetical protein, partial [Aeromonas caviae]|uniref:hypothetical protein n=1 Tax=Aeromonas caviae TaxID=648 RepID=UPI003F749011
MLTNNPLPVLAPERIPARANGYSFMLHDAQWRLDKNTIVGVGAIHDLLDATTLNGLLNTLSYYASNMSPGHTENAFIWFLSYVRTTKEGANKRGNSSRLTQSFHFFMFE